MKKLRKNSKGSTAIEFGIIAPVLFLLILGILEFGLTMFYDSSLNTGIRTAARQGAAQGFDNVNQINQIMSQNLGGLYNTDPANTTLIVFTYNNFDQMATDTAAFKANPDSFFPPAPTPTALPAKLCTITDPPKNTCQSAQIALYGVRYKWGGITGIMAPFVPKYLYSFSIVRNENYTE